MHIHIRQVTSTIVLAIVIAGLTSFLLLGTQLYKGEISGKAMVVSLMGYRFIDANDIIFQEGKTDCGPAALLNVFHHYKIESTLDEIEEFAATTDQGTSMLGLKEAAELKGLRAEGWKYTWGDFQSIPLPSIVFIRGNHYAVVESFGDRGSLIILDPAIGRLEMTEKKFRRIWSGETLQIKKADSDESAFVTEDYRYVIVEEHR